MLDNVTELFSLRDHIECECLLDGSEGMKIACDIKRIWGVGIHFKFVISFSFKKSKNRVQRSAQMHLLRIRSLKVVSSVYAIKNFVHYSTLELGRECLSHFGD